MKIGLVIRCNPLLLTLAAAAAAVMLFISEGVGRPADALERPPTVTTVRSPTQQHDRDQAPARRAAQRLGVQRRGAAILHERPTEGPEPC